MNTALANNRPVASSAVPAFRESGKSLASLHEDVMTPEQFFMPRDRTAVAWTSERRLLLAVLEDAVSSFLRHRHSCTKRAQRLFHEDKLWFASRDHSWVFSFESICDQLNLDANYIRRGLRQLLVAEATPPKEVRADPMLDDKVSQTFLVKRGVDANAC